MGKSRRTRRWVLVVVIIVVLAIAGARVMGGRRVAPANAATTPSYFVERSVKGSFTGQVAASGSIVPKALATVESPTAGTVSSFAVKEGDTVSAGETIARLSSGGTIASPIAGEVVSLPVSSGDYVTAGETLADVADMSAMFADLTVPEQDISQLAKGQPVSLTLPALPDRTFDGTVTEVGRQGSQGSSGGVEFPVTVKVKDPTGILIGMTVSAMVTTGTIPNAIYVPTSAIQTVNGRTAVLEPASTLSLPFGSPNGGTGSGNGFTRARTFAGGGFRRSGGFLSSLFGGVQQGDTSNFTRSTIPQTVYVTVGETNASDTEIVSGLAAGQEVLVPNPAAASLTPTGTGGGAGFGFRGGGGGF